MEAMWYWYQNKQINETDEELRKKLTDMWTTVCFLQSCEASLVEKE